MNERRRRGWGPVQESGHSWGDGWSKRLHVIHEVAHITGEEADTAALHVDGHLADALEHVGQREEGHHDIGAVGLLIAQLEQSGADVSHDVLVAQHDPFRIARRPRSVADRAQIARLRRLFWIQGNIAVDQSC